MFTGIIQAVGQVSRIEDSNLDISAGPGFRDEEIAIGESIAVNGACLTVVQLSDEGVLSFDVSPETFVRTSLGGLKAGSKVNLERAMKVNDRFGGHIVQGHVDATGTLESVRPEGEFQVYGFQAPAVLDRYLIDKGSIAVDGISLTIVEPSAGSFQVWIVPHTLENTNLGSLAIGDRVNLEVDVIAKHVEKLLSANKIQGAAV